jgi:glycerophosphoryl diester phosphodiesterase
MALPPLFAHRLGRAYGPDSSIAALERALAGSDGVETDVCLTADEQLVLLHDPLLSAGTNLQGWVHEHSLDQIRREAVLLDRDACPTGERPLSLDELLDATPRDMPVQVDIKAHADPELAARTARVLCERYGRTRQCRRIEVISFHSSACVVAAAHGFASRLVVFADYAPEALATWASRHGVGGVSVEHFLLTRRLARVFRLAGLSVNTGTINDTELRLRVVRTACPDAVCSDRPAELRRGARLLDEGTAPRQLSNAAVA